MLLLTFLAIYFALPYGWLADWPTGSDRLLRYVQLHTLLARFLVDIWGDLTISW